MEKSISESTEQQQNLSRFTGKKKSNYKVCAHGFLPVKNFRTKPQRCTAVKDKCMHIALKSQTKYHFL